MKKKPFHFGHGKTVLAIHKRQSPPIASLFATAPIDAGPNSKCGIFRDYFLSFFIFASILVARSWPATVSAISGPNCPRPLWLDKGAHISLDPYDHHIVMVRAHHGGTQVRPQMGTQFFMEGPNWDPISVTRDPIVDPNVAPIGDPIWDPIVFCGQLRTKSFVRECGVGWGGLFGGVAADVNCDEFHVIWVHNWVPPKQFGSQFGPSKQNWVPLKRALTMTR